MYPIAGNMTKKELEREIEHLKTMGIDFEFDENTTDEEKFQALKSLEEQLLELAKEQGIETPFTINSTEDATLNNMTELAQDITLNNQRVLDRLKELANDPNLAFDTDGLYKLYEIISEESLILQLDHHDPVEIVECLNVIFKYHKKEVLDIEFLEELEEKMFDTEDDYEYVWNELGNEIDNRGLTLMILKPLEGLWGEQVLIPISKEKSQKWVNKGFGNFGLIPFFEE